MKSKSVFFILFSILILLPGSYFAQIRLNAGAKIVIDGGTVANKIFVVLANPPATPIVTSGATDGIIMENEYNRLQLNLTTATTAITVPYMSSITNGLESFPLTVTPSAGGTETGAGTGNILFSTKIAGTRATGFDNSTYMPSDVTNMNSAWIGGANNSAKVIDRFWIIDANGYSTKPAVTLNFTYVDSEWAANGGNTVAEANLGAQRFDNSINQWNGYMPQGTTTIAANTVTSVTVSAANFFRTWTLADKTTPLPIELVRFEGTCSGKNILLNWETASETNNNYFTMERSADGITFQSIATINGAGNSTSTLSYLFSDNNPPTNGAYYRLKQTDYNGNSETSSVIFVPSCIDNTNNIDVYSQGENEYTLLINSTIADSYTITLYSALGQIVLSQKIYVSEGYNRLLIPLENIAPAMYFVNVTNSKEKSFTKKIVLSHY